MGKRESFLFHASESSYDREARVANWVIFITGCIVGVLVLVFACIGSFKAFSRYQAREDAQNRVRVNEITIHTYEQKVKIAEQEANIRIKRAIGIRKAQDEISATLTPLYVQFEMVHSLQEIAKSGSNNSVVFIPSGEGGVPLVTTLGDVMKKAAE